MVEARYMCKRCETRFSVEAQSMTEPAAPVPCRACGGEKRLLEYLDPMGHEPPAWRGIYGGDILLWAIVLAIAGVSGVAALLGK
jgi:DNA-directed RNA polymerase subunit RPC12/RpoP